MLGTRANRLGDISVSYVAVMARTLRSRGHDPAPWLARYRVSRGLLNTPGARISIPRFMRMGHAAIQMTGEPALGLAFGSHTRMTDLGLAGMAAASAPTLGEALATLVRYERLMSTNSRGQSHTERTADGGLSAVFYSISPYNRYNCFVVDSILAGWVAFLRELGGQDPLLVKVGIEYTEPANAQQYRQWFGCPVQFEAEQNRIDLPPGTALHPNRLAQAALFQELCQHCETERQRLAWGQSTTERAREAIAQRMGSAPPSMAEVALGLGTTEWGLRRALEQEGLTYRALLDRTRRELAEDYVRGTPLSFSDIASLVGFANPSAFHGAFRRWYGCSPGRYRRRYGMAR
ncbi:AraC family transcriptional regulator [Halomonadaceae bacterium KBTZ08]